MADTDNNELGKKEVRRQEGELRLALPLNANLYTVKTHWGVEVRRGRNCTGREKSRENKNAKRLIERTERTFINKKKVF